MMNATRTDSAAGIGQGQLVSRQVRDSASIPQTLWGRSSSGSKLVSHRTTARVVGGLFIAATVSGLLGAVFQQPAFGAHDYLTKASLNATGVATAAVLELIEAMTIVGIAVAIYTVLRQFSERLALGYIAVRSMEGMVIVIGTIVELTLLTVSQKYVGAGSHDVSLQTLGAVLLAGHDWVYNAVLPIVYPLGALILNYVLFQTRLVPRWLSVWGLGGAALFLASGVMVAYGVGTMPVLAAPIGLQEQALALWLIFKGFNAAALQLEVGEALTDSTTPSSLRSGLAS
jgi:uncharacterized protein DUF4386